MKYKKIKSYEYTEDELRKLWHETYCLAPIITFDRIIVKFYETMFDHAFFESANHKQKDKSILSLNRCEKILWIKDTLQDPEAILKRGWNKKAKSYENSRRVALIKKDYLVIILIYAEKKARFITAYQVDDNRNLDRIKNSPDWHKKDAD